MIEVKNLVKEFSTDNGTLRAIDDVSFKVNKAEVFGIIGLSGAGKSTLVRCINKLEEPTSGEIIIDDVPILELNNEELLKHRKDIGMIFQSFNLFMQKTVYDNIAYPLKIVDTPKDKIKARVEELLKFIDLEDKKDNYPAQLSGGQQQRVAIARAIATNPKILLSDEGTSALDPANTKSILELLKKIVEKYHMTIIMITHQMEVAQDICDRIAVMENGKIIEENTTDELFKNPKHSMTRSFIKNLGSNNSETEVLAKDFDNPIYRLAYLDSNYKEAVLSQCIKKFDVDINLIAGNINRIKDKAVGYLIVEFIGNDTDNAIEYLRSLNVSVEEVKNE
ncbi:methionine ABC transporter ATP-binding protein [Peptoniphilus obesi]|uniref:methionine ABC transporter ATP-binding protein n=1 Tax=Peptoniphilus obesi TaxID=1472765 RepID=UPI0004B72BBC|nr:ATP-binding cassette domain-containing protein [Peptoniphilus obesi]